MGNSEKCMSCTNADCGLPSYSHCGGCDCCKKKGKGT